MRRRLGFVLLTAFTLSGCGDLPSFWAPDPASEQGERVFDLWRGFFVAALAVGALVWGLLLYVLLRYRRRSDDVPNQRHFNIPVEVLYTVAPVVVVAFLFAASVLAENDVTDTVDDPDLTVEVVGFQWQWRFTYPDHDVTLVGTPEDGPPELVVPVGETIRFELESVDVVHSFWVPDFLEKRDLIPRVENEIDVTPTRTGTFVGRCAEFCGLDHWRMNFTVRVVEPDEFEDWLAEQEEDDR